jgi:prepilin-type N-terminal cleavage/methylation domain-containing protein
MIKRNTKKGFTIVELVIVIAVIAILAAVLIPTFAGIVSKAKESKALQDVRNAYSATVAKNLTDDDATNDSAFDGKIVYVHYESAVHVKVTNGVAEVVDEAPTGTNVVTCTISNGFLTNS